MKKITLNQLEVVLDRYYDEDGIGNNEGATEKTLRRLEGSDLLKALSKSIGCDCCADYNFYRIRGALINELARRAHITKEN
jgi:hypothetical protein